MKKILISLMFSLFTLPSIASTEIKKELYKPQKVPLVKLKVGNKSTNTKKFQSQSNDLFLLNKMMGKELLKAINTGRLIVQPHTKIQIEEIASNGFCRIPGKSVKINGYRASASKELLSLLYSIINSPQITAENPFGLLSLFRYGRSHGRLQRDGTLICSAIDIDNYAGFKIHMRNPKHALLGIVKVISVFPSGKYVIGLPRPGGGRLIDPQNDYFLPVNNLSQNESSPTGNLIGDLNLIKNPEAKKNITKAILNNTKAKVLFLMPDAVDHLHIKALKEVEIQ